MSKTFAELEQEHRIKVLRGRRHVYGSKKIIFNSLYYCGCCCKELGENDVIRVKDISVFSLSPSGKQRRKREGLTHLNRLLHKECHLPVRLSPR